VILFNAQPLLLSHNPNQEADWTFPPPPPIVARRFSAFMLPPKTEGADRI